MEEQTKEIKLQFYTTLSKTLSWVLRHKAVALGLEVLPDGYISVSDILALKQF